MASILRMTNLSKENEVDLKRLTCQDIHNISYMRKATKILTNHFLNDLI